PDDPDVSFAGCYGGSLEMKHRKTGAERAVNPWPSNPMGHSSEDIKYRMQWTFPIVYSPHDSTVLYVGSNVLFKTTNGGQSFDIISPDLTRHDPKTMGPSGGPITKDQTGVETYATIFTIAESPKEKGTIWTGSDDGYVQITRDAGRTWTNVTPKDLGDFTRVSLIEASPHVAGKAYVAAHRHQFGDLRPTIWRTTDYGKSWTKLGAGIAQDEFVRAVREDPERRGLLYAGTERGVWVSFDDGVKWQSLRNNLPMVPVHALVVKEGDLVVATHGRSFYIMDDLSALRQVSPALVQKPAHLFKPRDAYRVNWSGGFGGGDRGPHPAGRNPQDGAVVYYTLRKPNQEVTLDFLDGKGNLLRSFTSKLDNIGLADSVRADSLTKAREDSLKSVGKPIPQPEDAALAAEEQPDFETMMRRGPRPPRVPNKVGLNSFAWNLRHPDAVRFANMIMWAAGTNGPMVAPGTFTVRMKAGGETQSQTFAVRLDPRTATPASDVEEQVAFLLRIRDRVSDANNAVRMVRSVRFQLDDRKQRAAGPRKDEFVRAADALSRVISAAEEEIYQVRNQSSQDPLNYPIKLNNKIAALSGVVGTGDSKPTAQAYVVFEELSGQLGNQLSTLRKELQALDQINVMLKAMRLPIIVPSTDEPSQAKPEIAANELGSRK
ncbi:MAG: WD40/YVTN/BNR-like repeat-containing protein, partial [Gemmatimonadaceae bacterium]